MKTTIAAAFIFFMLAPLQGLAADEHFLTLQSGEPVEFALTGIPGAGSTWDYLADESWNENTISVESLGYGEQLTDRIGGPALYFFRLTPLESGMARLEFSYGRPWEDGMTKRHLLWVYVRPKP